MQSVLEPNDWLDNALMRARCAALKEVMPVASTRPIIVSLSQGANAFLLGAGATTVGYLLYGGISFGLTEFLKRRFVELAGPDLAALYPIPILLGARCVYSARQGAACLSCGSTMRAGQLEAVCHISVPFVLVVVVLCPHVDTAVITRRTEIFYCRPVLYVVGCEVGQHKSDVTTTLCL